MLTKTRATIEDLYKIDGKAELVNGEIVEFSPQGCMPGYAGDEIYVALRAYVKRVGTGKAVSGTQVFHVDLPNRQSFSPDAAYHLGANTGMRFLEGAPVFAVEVRSENDYGAAKEQEMADKCADYFFAGTIVVWDVDLLSLDVVRKYTADSPTTPRIFRKGELADAEPAVPGWRMPVIGLFAPDSTPLLIK